MTPNFTSPLGKGLLKWIYFYISLFVSRGDCDLFNDWWESLHSSEKFLARQTRYLRGVTLLSQDRCSLRKTNEAIDGLYESWPDRSNVLQFKRFQCCIDFTFDDFRSLLVPWRWLMLHLLLKENDYSQSCEQSAWIKSFVIAQEFRGAHPLFRFLSFFRLDECSLLCIN